MSILGDRIKKERENLNLTREDLSKKIGVSYSAVAMYEQGNREPNNELLLKMCETFDCSLDYLMGKSDYKSVWEEYDATHDINKIKQDVEKSEKATETEINDIYMHLAKEAQDLKLDKNDVDFILDFYRKHKK